MTRAFRLLLLLLCLAAGAAAEAQEVTKVIDGATLEVEGVGKVRLVGVAANERDVRFGPTGPAAPPRSGPDQPPPSLIGGSIGIKPDSSSRNALSQLVLGKRVRLEYDDGSKKGHGTPRAYVFLPDDTLVNAEMIRSGVARVDTSRPFASVAEFKKLEEEARQEFRGVWADVSKH